MQNLSKKPKLFDIERETPRSEFCAFRRRLDLDTAKETLADIAKQYDANDAKKIASSLSDDGMKLSAYERGYLHSFRIVPSEY